jgi:hypothetical protein
MSEDTITAVAPRVRPRPRTRLVPVPRPEPPRAEALETLSLPPGLDEDILPPGALPRSEDQVRVDIIRVARDLGREYRQRGVVLRMDAAAIPAMQLRLIEYAEAVLAGRMDPRGLAPEVVRHGAALGEILARFLGASWSNLTTSEPARWQMHVPPLTKINPVARVHQFLLHRAREQDLVGCFQQLETESRRASHVTLV